MESLEICVWKAIIKNDACKKGKEVRLSDLNETQKRCYLHCDGYGNLPNEEECKGYDHLVVKYG